MPRDPQRIAALFLAGCATLCGDEALAAGAPPGTLADTMEQRLAGCAQRHGISSPKVRAC